MPKKIIIKPAQSPAAVGPYSHAVRVGDLLFCAGQIPIDPATGNLVSGDIQAQTERVLPKHQSGSGRPEIDVRQRGQKHGVYDQSRGLCGMNEIYAKYFTGDSRRVSTVQVAALPKGANVKLKSWRTIKTT